MHSTFIEKTSLTQVCLSWRIVRQDGIELNFVEMDCDLIYNNKLYKAANGFNSSAIKKDSSLEIDNLDIEGILNSDSIKTNEILAGYYDNAMIEINLLSLKPGQPIVEKSLFLKRGYIGAIKIIGKDKFVAEINGFLESGNNITTKRYGNLCRANLGDDKCKFNIEKYTHYGNITEVIDNKTFRDSSMFQHNGYFDNGFISIINKSKNLIKSTSIKFFIDNIFELCEPISDEILSQGANYIASIGCDKTANTCSKKFNNIVNFRGEPHIPGMSKVYSR
jgi:uncharacterized phage protein (TIGR02218 family)